MPLKEFTPTDVLDLTCRALRACGLNDAMVRLVPDNLIGDDDPRCEGYVLIDDWIDIYPSWWAMRSGGVCGTRHALPGVAPCLTAILATPMSTTLWISWLRLSPLTASTRNTHTLGHQGQRWMLRFFAG